MRERNKQEKCQRIQRAAQQLFTQKGFAVTIMREVAELAQVGSGTLFLYAKDKLDLLQLVYLVWPIWCNNWPSSLNPRGPVSTQCEENNWSSSRWESSC